MGTNDACGVTTWMMSCRTLSVIEVGTSTCRQIKESVCRSSMRTVAISLKIEEEQTWLEFDFAEAKFAAQQRIQRVDV